MEQHHIPWHLKAAQPPQQSPVLEQLLRRASMVVLQQCADAGMTRLLMARPASHCDAALRSSSSTEADV